jgi:hypothetical protein
VGLFEIILSCYWYLKVYAEILGQEGKPGIHFEEVTELPCVAVQVVHVTRSLADRQKGKKSRLWLPSRELSYTCSQEVSPLPNLLVTVL